MLMFPEKKEAAKRIWLVLVVREVLKQSSHYFKATIPEQLSQSSCPKVYFGW